LLDLRGLVRLARSDRGEREDRKLGDPPRQVGEEPQARRVRPVRVVDGEDERARLREVGYEPVEPVDRRDGIRGRRRSLGVLSPERE